MVPYDNLNNVKAKWDRGTYKVVTTPNRYDHGKIAVIFFIQVHDKLVQEMLRGTWTSGEYNFYSELPSEI